MDLLLLFFCVVQISLNWRSDRKFLDFWFQFSLVWETSTWIRTNLDDQIGDFVGFIESGCEVVGFVNDQPEVPQVT